MNIDFIIAASPTSAFFSQIAFFRRALNALGKPYEDARVVALLGNESRTSVPDRWGRHLSGVEIVWAPHAEFRRTKHLAQFASALPVSRETADVVILCDADTVVLRRLDTVLERAINECALGGVIAHYPPPVSDELVQRRPLNRIRRWLPPRQRNLERARAVAHEGMWDIISGGILGRRIPREFHYTLQAEPEACPFYINHGVVIIPRKIVSQLRGVHGRFCSQTMQFLSGSYYSFQVGLTMAVYALGIPVMALPMRYNYPNDPIADSKYPEELREAAFMHYLRTTHFDRWKVFENRESFDSLLRIDSLEGSNRVFRDFVRANTDGQYPFN